MMVPPSADVLLHEAFSDHIAKRQARRKAFFERIARFYAVEYPPSGCANCDMAERLHFDRSAWGTNWHPYAPPTGQQIKARMLSRRRVAQRRVTAARSLAVRTDIRGGA